MHYETHLVTIWSGNVHGFFDGQESILAPTLLSRKDFVVKGRSRKV
jgi:hypothetical protein